MNMIEQRVQELVPAHFREYAPRFIAFLTKYYEWLNRSSGLSQAEIDDLMNDTSWLTADLDQFIETGKMKYVDPVANPNVLQDSVNVLKHTVAPGNVAVNMLDAFLMEGDFNGNSDETGGVPGTADPTVELPTIENAVLDGWFDSMGFDRIKRSKLETLNNIDQVLMISLLKHVYAIKGTEASIKLFFLLMFGEEPFVGYPKQSLAVLDEQFVLDDVVSVLRDDDLYQEYSYVITLVQNLDYYKEAFETIYKKILHPAGFKVALARFDFLSQCILLEDGSNAYLLVEEGVYLDAYELII
jgi:hypothetical protein